MPSVVTMKQEVQRWLRSEKLEPIPKILVGEPAIVRYRPVTPGTVWPPKKVRRSWLD